MYFINNLYNYLNYIYIKVICNLNILIYRFFYTFVNGFFISDYKIKSNNSNNNFDKLIIVAHPDDEMLFFGDLIINNLSTITILCLTNSSNIIRAKEFITVMNYCNIYNYEMWDYIDSKNHIECNELEEKLKDYIEKFKYIYTHSETGETGHPQHIMINKIITKLAPEKLYIPYIRYINKSLSDFKNKIFQLYKSQEFTINRYKYLSISENFQKY